MRFPRSDYKEFTGLPEGFVTFEKFAALQEAQPDPLHLNSARSALAARKKVRGLARLRMEAGFSQSELSSKVGTSQPRLSMWERGTEKPSIESLKKLRDALRVSYEELMDALNV